MSKDIEFYVGSISDETPEFDFVCANLTADVIVPLLPLLIEKAKRILVLSGILKEQENLIVEELKKFKIENPKIETDGEWISILVTDRQKQYASRIENSRYFYINCPLLLLTAPSCGGVASGISPSSVIVNRGWRGFGLPFESLPIRRIGAKFRREVLTGESASERFRIEPPRPAIHKSVPPR